MHGNVTQEYTSIDTSPYLANDSSIESTGESYVYDVISFITIVVVSNLFNFVNWYLRDGDIIQLHLQKLQSSLCEFK